jgi:hypothetical protein
VLHRAQRACSRFQCHVHVPSAPFLHDATQTRGDGRAMPVSNTAVRRGACEWGGEDGSTTPMPRWPRCDHRGTSSANQGEGKQSGGYCTLESRRDFWSRGRSCTTVRLPKRNAPLSPPNPAQRDGRGPLGLLYGSSKHFPQHPRPPVWTSASKAARPATRMQSTAIALPAVLHSRARSQPGSVSTSGACGAVTGTACIRRCATTLSTAKITSAIQTRPKPTSRARVIGSS